MDLAAPPGLAARRAALALIARVIDERRMLSDPGPALDGLTPAERAEAQRLAASVLRHLARIETVLTAFVPRRPPPAAEAVLRLMTAELLAEGTAPHAAVDMGVRLAEGIGGKGLKGLVNAVGRRVAREGAAIWADARPKRLPRWIGRPVTAAWGAEALAAIEAAHEKAAPLDLTPREAAESAALAAEIGAELLPTGSLRLAGHPQVTALAGFAEGRWWVQDAAAALPVRLLGDVAGLAVLDLCAAPGGKTLQLAAAGARVTAVDADPARMERLTENLARTGLGAETVVADALDWEPEGPFDLVLLDAPCTATGTIRRHPDLPFVRREADLDRLVALQAQLLDRAAGWVRPGGRLAYVTCSLLPGEGEAQAAAFLARHPDFAQVPLDGPAVEPGWLTPEGGLRLRPDFWPDRGGMDGFFAAVLARR